ncbi:MAG: amidophosphoribosyltransferase [Alphaproteobacteria bacterium]|nr:amidophosphoribosyltransferase [Alphaproteobacteria bacterium]
MLDTLKEACGVIGIFNHPDATQLTYLCLKALQHRGQEGAGIVTSDTQNHHIVRGEGLVDQVFNKQKLDTLLGIHAIGHVRYSTKGGKCLENVQPFLFRHHSGDFALCHNGNIVNSDILKNNLEAQGSLFQSTSDTEIMAHLFKKNYTDAQRFEIIKNSLNQLEGAFTFLLLTKKILYAMRDKHGLRPLSLGRLDNGGYIVASETCCFDILNATFIRDIEPGEVIGISLEELHTTHYSQNITHKMCAMEYIYFSRPDSQIESINVHNFRKQCGKVLAQKHPVANADLVIGVPDSSLSAAMGYASESKIPYELGLVKNKYVGRTFIEPTQILREHALKIKLSVVKAIVEGKKLVVVDDSIVRGNTSKNIIKLLRKAGAKEVHFRLASPPFSYPCFYGVDTSTFEELIAAKQSIEDVRKFIEADSLEYLTPDELLETQRTFNNGKSLCLACFTGKYPTKTNF